MIETRLSQCLNKVMNRWDCNSIFIIEGGKSMSESALDAVALNYIGKVEQRIWYEE